MEAMRRTLLWASTNPWLATRLPRRRFVQRAVRRFMPGERLEDALREATALRGRGAASIVTMLGENLETAEATRPIVDEYGRAIEEAADRGLDLEISVKPTHLGLDASEDLAYRNLSTLAARAAGRGTLWIDMEGSDYTDRTLDLYRSLRAEHRNVGVCLQAYLRRTADDLESLLSNGPYIRLVKGAYAEPAELAFEARSEVDASYLELSRRLMTHLGTGGEGFLAVGTHDAEMIRPLAELARELGLPDDRWEVEMLYGIRVRAQERLVSEGVPLRVLISYGAAWFPWYMRRLAERPANVWFVLRSLVR